MSYIVVLPVKRTLLTDIRRTRRTCKFHLQGDIIKEMCCWFGSSDCKGKTCRKHTYVLPTNTRFICYDLRAFLLHFTWMLIVPTKSPSTRLERLLSSLRESVVMTENNPVMVVRPSPSSTRRQRPRRRLSSVSNVPFASTRHNCHWSDASSTSHQIDLVSYIL